MGARAPRRGWRSARLPAQALFLLAAGCLGISPPPPPTAANLWPEHAGRAKEAFAQGELPGALAEIEAGLELCRAADCLPGQARLLNDRAAILLEAARAREALADLDQALPLAAGEEGLAAALRLNRALARLALDDLPGAAGELAGLRERCRRARDRAGEARALAAAARLLAAQGGEAAAVETLFAEAERLAVRAGGQGTLAGLLRRRGEWRAGPGGRPEAGRADLERALALFKGGENPGAPAYLPGILAALAALEHACRLAGDEEAARDFGARARRAAATPQLAWHPLARALANAAPAAP